jgi:hypothetical protein
MTGGPGRDNLGHPVFAAIFFVITVLGLAQMSYIVPT